MNNMIQGLIWELLLLAFLGVLYYFYQKRKLISYELNKTPVIISYLLQSSLSERGEENNLELDSIIASLDDYLKNKSKTIPFKELNTYSRRKDCSPEFRQIIIDSLEELNETTKK
jgi:hypothetical protein